MNKKLCTLLLACFIISAAFAQSNFNLLQSAQFETDCINSGGLAKGNTFTLNTSELVKLHQTAPNELTLHFNLPDEGNVEVQLFKKNILSPGFKVSTATGVQDNIDLGIHYQGRINGDENSLVAISFFKHTMYGLIANNNGNYTIAALKDPITKQIDNRFIIYNDRDLTIENHFTCATDLLDQPEPESVPNGSNRATTNCKTVTQYYECDFAMYNDNGSSVPNTVAFTTAMFNVVSGIYNGDGIDIEISEIFVWNTADPYPSTSSFDALDAF